MSSETETKALLVMDLFKQVRSYLDFRKKFYPDHALEMTGNISSDLKIKISSVPKIMNNEEFGSLEELENTVNNCKKCQLHLTRKNAVFGKGSGKLKLLIIGEAPGAEEDDKGEPFIGRAGKLLTKMLSAIGIERDDVYICNVLKCRPPDNRDPLPEEIEKCSYYLDRQLDFLKPDQILALGRIAAVRLLGKNETMKELREKIHSYKGIPVYVTYHPSALLRNPKWKYPAWDDLQKLKEAMGIKIEH